ncbi:MAG: hypothetical protein A2X28_11380 [Elusimicrobia bacterium GWA2_56_46]|nr:MAG: hypothetical protein A2X28_11380 [Elusimicrobia bacterium GWA2_56_46]OGR54539.1 MAG: hypothetical protein A2X39_10165 [Elusimicrobia bacterium GWC2_56_31]HBB67256.1 hypothetical protein [Elusimicrobiota bacterium]HBW22341.1 hypothetical protein [Elusimicrobiota bacterium]
MLPFLTTFRSRLGIKYLSLVTAAVLSILTLAGAVIIAHQKNSLVEIYALLNKHTEMNSMMFGESLQTLAERSDANQLASAQDTGKALAELMAELGPDKLRNGDLKALNCHLQALVRNKNVVYGAYLDAKKRPLAKAFGSARSPDTMKILLPVRSGGTDVGFFELELSKNGFSRQAQYNQTIIAATLEMQKRYEEETLRKALSFIELSTRTAVFNISAVTVLSILALLLILAYFFSRTTLRPILAITATASAVARTGDLSGRIGITADNELGELAEAFNKMVSSLRNTTVNRDELNKEVQERKKTEAFIKGVMENVGPLIVTDTQYRIILANPAFCGLAGRPLDEVIGKPCYEAFHRCDTPCFTKTGECSAKAALETKKPARAEYKREAPGGTASYEARSYPLLNNEGDVISVIQTITDTTEQKNMEARTRQSEKMSAIGQLAAGVAHEINNPMGIILGFAQSLVKTVKENDPLKTPLKSIEREAMRCKELVQNLLVFSRASSRSAHPAFDPNSSIESALSLILPQARMQNVEIVKDLRSPLPMITADSGQLQQVIINLCSNAIDAMPSGGRLTIGTSLSRRDGKDFIRIDVSDTGSGIPKELHAKIFNPFFTTKEVGKGTGLGLSLVHEIVTRHAGTIELESEPGKGAKFSVYLPVPPAPPSAA